MKRKEMKVTASLEREKADLQRLAEGLLEEAMRFYEDPENEKAFQEWMAKREGA